MFCLEKRSLKTKYATIAPTTTTAKLLIGRVVELANNLALYAFTKK
jgi:hypothetical protein